jgi:hypothetical protein
MNPPGKHLNLTTMFAKVKSRVFIDSLRFELEDAPREVLKAVLRDDRGCICSTLLPDTPVKNNELIWTGLNHLPYGVYTLELSQGEDEMKLQLVKRV